MISVTTQQKRFLGIATALAIILGAYFLKHYVMLIIFAAIVSFIFNPLFHRLQQHRKPSTAAAITLLASIVAVIIPITIVLVLTGYQVINLVEWVKTASQNTNINELINGIVQYVNNIFSSVGVSYRISQDAITNGIGQALKAFGEAILGSLGGIASSLSGLISSSIIYIYVFISLLVNQQKLLNSFHELNPLGRDVSNLYVKRAATMTKAMVKGQFIIAIAQGVTDATLLHVAGMKSLFFFFFVLLTLLSIIPLGGGIVAIPIGVTMILMGNIWQGLLVILGHILIVTNIDNVLRPRLIPKEARLDPALTLLSVFSGLAFFGFIGIIVGPVIMILIVTTIQVYFEVFKNVSIPKVANSKHSGILRRLLRK